MAPAKQRSRQSSSAGSAAPSRPAPSPSLESQIEVLYNTSVQSFVRRDHVKTSSTLSRLLTLLRQKRPESGSNARQPAWYDLDSVTGDEDGDGRLIDEWTIKTLKLCISSTASLYADPPVNVSLLPDQLQPLLPPVEPSVALSYLRILCQESYPTENPTLIPPQILSTLILASLKLRPSGPALQFIHRTCEDWIAALPDPLIETISPRLAANKSAKGKQDGRYRKKVESTREGYLKIVELFVGEVLSREDEFEMARAFLDGEVVMGSKRKEALYRHLRALQSASNKVQPEAPSPSASLVLPSGSSSSSMTSRPRSHRDRSSSRSSTSSSSSEQTARPGAGQVALSRDEVKGKGRERATESEVTRKDEDGSKPVDDGKATAAASSRLQLGSDNGPSTPKSISPSPPGSNHFIQSILRILPPSLSSKVATIISDLPIDTLLARLALPLPLVILAIFIIRRRRRTTAATTGLTVAATTGTASDIRSRLALARLRGEGGWYHWVMLYLRWWINKFGGVWKLGTTITYV